MRYRFLFDECLTPALVGVAEACGHEGAHAGHRGLLSASDPKIAAYAIDHDLIVVTNNKRDYLRLYAREVLHPGLVILLPSVDADLQQRLFKAVLVWLALEQDLVNRALEVARDGSIVAYDWSAAAR